MRIYSRVNAARRIGRLLLSGLLVFGLLAGMTLPASAAMIVTFGGLTSGVHSIQETHYEITLPGHITAATFSLTFEEAVYDDRPFFLADTDTFGPVEAVYPASDTISDPLPKAITLLLTPNEGEEERSGAVTFSLGYEETGEPIGTIEIRVTQSPIPADSAPWSEESGIPFEAAFGMPEELLLELVQGSMSHPRIILVGEGAALVYQLETEEEAQPFQDIRLDIDDITALEKDTALSVAGFVPFFGGPEYEVELPAAQVNAVLSAKAAQIAESLEGISYREDTGRSTRSITVLAPIDAITLPPDGAIFPINEAFAVSEEEPLLLEIAAADLANLAETDIALGLKVSYKDVAAPSIVYVELPLTDSLLFPGLSGEDASLPGGMSDDDVPRISEDGALELTGTLTQEYDPKSGRFLLLGEDFILETSIPANHTTAEQVRLYFPAGLGHSLFRDDEPIDYLSGQPLAEDGVYRLVLQRSYRPEASVEDVDADGQEDTPQPVPEPALPVTATYTFTFRIAREPTGSLPVYNAPTGYVIAEVSLRDGLPPAETDLSETYCFLREDGVYTLLLRGEGKGFPDLEETLIIDRTPPTIVLHGVGIGYSSSNPGTAYGADEPGISFAVYHNGRPVEAAGILARPGHYRIEATDRAGNTAVLETTIRRRFRLSAGSAALLLSVALAGGAAWFFYRRTHMRVR